MTGIFVHEDAAGLLDPIEQWLKAYDPDALDGRGTFAFTPNPAEALAFPSAREALEYWRQPSTVRPLRPDGRPNRPLTAFTVSIKPLERR